ncbi:MAG: hypothetical protein ACR2PI_13095, partial [Hyphomicrobiaceae bacterium]
QSAAGHQDRLDQIREVDTRSWRATPNAVSAVEVPLTTPSFLGITDKGVAGDFGKSHPCR